MRDDRDEIVSYCGYRGEERPAAIIRRGRRVGISMIERMWIEEDAVDGRRRRFFDVVCEEGRFRLVYDERAMKWFSCRLRGSQL